MNAIIRLRPTESSGIFFKQLFLPKDTVIQSVIGKVPVEIHSLNPLCHKQFPKLVSQIKKRCTRVFFTEEMKQYPHIIHQIPVGDHLFRHLPEILSQMAIRERSDVGVLCEKEDPRLIPLVEILSQYAPSVSILTKNDAFFERISQSLLATHGMSLNQKTTETMGKKQLLIVLNTSFSNCSPFGEFLIDLNDTPNLVHPNLLWDISTEETCKFFQTFHIADIKHCYFVPKEERKLKLIWKISKKS